MSKLLQLALVGFGKMGQEYARQIADIPDMRVAFIVEPGKANQAKALEAFPTSQTRIFSDLSEAMTVGGIDGWIICSATRTHVPVAHSLLKAGQRILLEKPIAESLEGAEVLRDHVLSDSSNLMMGHILLWSPQFQELRAQAQAGGEIREITALRQRSESHRIDYPDEPLFSLLMVHDLYCIQALTLGRQPESLVGRTSAHESGGEHFASAQLAWADSTVATAESNYFLANEPVGLIDDRIVVKGDDWTASVNFRGNFDQALRNEIDYFGALLRNEVAVPVGARYQDALQVQGWIDALISSAAGSNEGE